MTTLTRLEKYLLPPIEIVRWNNGDLKIEKCTTTQKVMHYMKNSVALTGLILVSPFTLAYDYLGQAQATTARKTADIAPAKPNWPPVQRGFACSFFQTSGLGTKWSTSPELAGKCDWDKWMDNPSHVIHPKGFDYKNFFTDVLSNPTTYIEMLKAHNVTAHRFSLEWAVIEPRPGEFDQKAVALYQNFIQKLIEAKITPSITLNHFVVPEWFFKAGNFHKLRNINYYLEFAAKAIETFPQVNDWWSFNELGIKAFQQAREVFPTDLPEGSFLSKRVYAAGIATRNMLIAHCKLHQHVAKKYPDKKVGVTHQWLKFDTATGNWLERLFSYYFTKFGFTPVYQFFEKGRYSFEFPFMANIQFEIPKEQFDENGRFLMQLGVQAYPKPMVKMGLNHGHTYPGLPSAIKNLPFFSFGSTCNPGEAVMRFGPRWNAKGMDEILDDAFALTDQVYITEFGSDACVHEWGKAGFEFNDLAQVNYLKQLTERIRSYCARTMREVKGIFCWSDLRRQLEWENRLESRVAIIEPHIDKKRRLIGWSPTPASEHIAQIYYQEIAHKSERTA